MSSNNRLLMLVGIVYVIASILTQVYLVVLTVEGKNQRAEIAIERRKQSEKADATLCVLRIQPKDRNDKNVNRCIESNVE